MASEVGKLHCFKRESPKIPHSPFISLQESSLSGTLLLLAGMLVIPHPSSQILTHLSFALQKVYPAEMKQPYSSFSPPMLIGSILSFSPSSIFSNEITSNFSSFSIPVILTRIPGSQFDLSSYSKGMDKAGLPGSS